MRSVIAIDSIGKLEMLGGQMAFEGDSADTGPSTAPAPCGHSPAALQEAFAPDARGMVNPSQAKKNALGVHDAVMPGGKRIRLLKTMLTSACERNCNYCPFRAGRDMRRATFKPEEMARTFSQIHQKGGAEGLFLSSGIAGGGVRTQDRLIDTIEILRNKLGFRGYVHLKIMPGAERDQLLRAMMLADRVSVNLEAPNSARLATLAPKKEFASELFTPLKWAADIRARMPPPQNATGRWGSFVTQFVVGGAGESDVELLQTTGALTKVGLQRAYFSAFHPVRDTPMENLPAENPWREHRLYQASFLLRDYGFDFEDLPFQQNGHLPLDTDPKLGWARQNLKHAPIDVNTAERQSLLKIPGIGPIGADAIIAARRVHTLRDLKQLKALGVNATRAAEFVLLDGARPAQQLALF